jgi:hypothetical protein
MSMVRLSEEKRRLRETVDAVRGVLGLAPLYYEKPTKMATWLTPLGEGYEDMVSRGGHLGVGHGDGGHR